MCTVQERDALEMCIHLTEKQCASAGVCRRPFPYSADSLCLPTVSVCFCSVCLPTVCVSFHSQCLSLQCVCLPTACVCPYICVCAISCMPARSQCVCQDSLRFLIQQPASLMPVHDQIRRNQFVCNLASAVEISLTSLLKNSQVSFVAFVDEPEHGDGLVLVA